MVTLDQEKNAIINSITSLVRPQGAELGIYSLLTLLECFTLMRKPEDINSLYQDSNTRPLNPSPCVIPLCYFRLKRLSQNSILSWCDWKLCFCIFTARGRFRSASTFFEKRSESSIFHFSATPGFFFFFFFFRSFWGCFAFLKRKKTWCHSTPQAEKNFNADKKLNHHNAKMLNRQKYVAKMLGCQNIRLPKC